MNGKNIIIWIFRDDQNYWLPLNVDTNKSLNFELWHLQISIPWFYLNFSFMVK